jgi:Mg2+-importing ATPase
VPERGLTSAESAARLEELGPNEPIAARRPGAAAQVVALLANPLVLILLIAGAVSGFVGEVVNAGLIVTIVALSIAANAAQTLRSQRAVERLRAGVAPTATVCRDGAWRERPRRELVPGDLVRLAAGDLVPADARLLCARDLHLQEAALTGESIPVEKAAGADVFLGTSVVSGAATAVVVATGARTAFGDVAARLAARKPETAFEHGLRQFAHLITRVVLFLVLFMLVVNLAFGRPGFESLLFAIALAVGLTPEFLPMITTVTLARGAVRMARERVIVKHLPAIQDLGSVDVLCSDKTGTLTAGAMTLDRAVDARGRDSSRVLELAYLNSAFETGIRSPLDAAILAGPAQDLAGWEKRDEIPFDFERRRLSIVAARGDERLLVCKGAPESVLPLASATDGAGPTFEALGAQGYRVLAVAWRRVPPRAAYSVADERDLTLAGFLAFADPPLPDAREALAALRRDGVTVKILTGDNELVARHVCAEVGLDVSEIVLGAEIERMSDSALGHIAERATVFARVNPAQKHRVLLALKGRGHVVGYLGDGINDAPSLHAADVGISVASAVDVAREAADLILVERGLRVLHRGILEGRRAFGNVMKYLFMGTSSNFGNMLSMAGATLFLPFLPMLPTQILLNNFLYDLAQITIPGDRVDEAAVRRPQRWDIRIIRNFMLFIGPISSLFDFLTFYALLHVFAAGATAFHTGWFVESLATQVLVLLVIRTAGNPLRSRPSVPLALAVGLVVVVGAALPFSPLAPMLGFERLPAAYFAFLAAVVAVYLCLVEIAKRMLLRGTAIAINAR